MLYAVGMTTGFRAGELASLEPSAFALDGEPPTATVKAAYSKNRRTSCLRGYFDGKPARDPVWPGSWADDAADMLRIDLEAAGIPFADEEGRVCDFHALRHSYLTLVQRSGVHPKVAQELARHSDSRLTMNVYTHAHLHDLAGAVEMLPSLLPSGRTALKATGTDGRHVLRHCPQHCPGVDSGRDLLRAVETPAEGDERDAGCRNPGSASALESDCDEVRVEERSAPCRTRTYNPLIKSHIQYCTFAIDGN